MASVDEALRTMSEIDYLHDEIQFLIDENLRTITIPPNGVVLGVVGDKNTNRVNFKMNRYYNGFDMSRFIIRINYVNAGIKKTPNYYTVTDAEVEDDYILFTWLVDADATAYEGVVSFIVHMFLADSSGIKTQIMNSTIATAKVLEGIDADLYTTPAEYQDLASKVLNYVIDSIDPIYVAKYNQTMFEDVVDAYNAGKTIIAVRPEYGDVFTFNYFQLDDDDNPVKAYFNGVFAENGSNPKCYTITVDEDEWSDSYDVLAKNSIFETSQALKSYDDCNDMHDDANNNGFYVKSFSIGADNSPESEDDGFVIGIRATAAWGTQIAVHSDLIKIRQLVNGTWNTWKSIDAEIQNATTTSAGLMSAQDKANLNALVSGAADVIALIGGE